MFSAALMKRVELLVLKCDERGVLAALGQLGVMELVRRLDSEDAIPLAAVDRSAERALCDGILERIDSLRSNLNPPQEEEDVGKVASMQLDQALGVVREWEERVGSLTEKRRCLLQRLKELAETRGRVAPYLELGIPLALSAEPSFLHFVIGGLPDESLERLSNEVGEAVLLIPLEKQAGRRMLVAVTSGHGKPALEDALLRTSFRQEPLPVVDDVSTDVNWKRINEEGDRVQAELDRVRAELRTVSLEAWGPLGEIESWAIAEEQLLKAEESCRSTPSTVLLSGWVPEADAPFVEQKIRALTGGRCVVHLSTPGKMSDAQIPVLLRHGRLLRPFLALLAPYGAPTYREVVPTPFFALSFISMFGMMFGDVGHGAVLVIGGLTALVFGQTARTRDGGLLVLLAGIGSVAFGFLYGSWFGIVGLKRYALWHDPLEGDPTALMLSGIGIGVLMISLGTALNIINRFRSGDILGGITDKFGLVGLVFYWGGILLLVGHFRGDSMPFSPWSAVLILGLPTATWVMKGPIECALLHRHDRTVHFGNLVSALGNSAVEAFEAGLMYLANTISFVRLAAYAMSHAALLMATFMLASLLQPVPRLGTVLAVSVIVLGNLVVIVLEGIVASVQGVRLEYYEFFGKFFSGGGRPFRPFRLVVQDRSKR